DEPVPAVEESPAAVPGQRTGRQDRRRLDRDGVETFDGMEVDAGNERTHEPAASDFIGTQLEQGRNRRRTNLRQGCGDLRGAGRPQLAVDGPVVGALDD